MTPLSLASFEPPKALVYYIVLVFGEFDERKRKKTENMSLTVFAPDLCRGKAWTLKLAGIMEWKLQAWNSGVRQSQFESPLSHLLSTL